MTYRLKPDPADSPVSAKSSTQVDKHKSESKSAKSPGRLISLDAFRGFIMVMLAANGFGIYALSRTDPDSPLWTFLNYETWQKIGFHFQHPGWQSNLVPGSIDATTGNAWLRWKVSFWDLIQPSFMFMVGMAMPFSYARRASHGDSPWRRTMHAFIRALVLVLLGVFLQSRSSSSTNWIFPNVLSQIGLGYFFVYLIMKLPTQGQWVAFGVILLGTWLAIHVTPSSDAYAPEEVSASYEAGEVFKEPYRRWSKNGNAFSDFDAWFLNLFPRPVDPETGEAESVINRGGYTTLNFVPSMATTLLGVFVGQFVLVAPRTRKSLGLLILAALLLTSLGVFAGATCCPIVKRIWTPAWVLFSGGYVVGMFAICYLLFDLLPLKKLAFPLVVVGMNSIAVYMMGQMMRPWISREVVGRHFSWAIDGLFNLIVDVSGSSYSAQQTQEMFEPVTTATSAFLVMWLICWWMYRQRIFVRI